MLHSLTALLVVGDIPPVARRQASGDCRPSIRWGPARGCKYPWADRLSTRSGKRKAGSSKDNDECGVIRLNSRKPGIVPSLTQSITCGDDARESHLSLKNGRQCIVGQTGPCAFDIAIRARD